MSKILNLNTDLRKNQAQNFHESSILYWSRWLTFVFLCVLCISGCRNTSTLTPTVSLPPGETSTPVVWSITDVPATQTPPSTHTSAPTLPHTLTPTIALSPTPINFLQPLYSHMGVELSGGNFIQKVPLASEAGAGWVRWNAVLWSSIEPQEGFRDWDSAIGLETRALAVSEAGMNLIAIIRRTPVWAQAVPGYYCGPVHPDKLEAFGIFLHDLVARYSQPPYNVKYWELGNEPDIAPSISAPDSFYGCWGDEADPYYGGQYFGEMLKVVYPLIKAADPDAQVLVGGLLLDCDPGNPPVSASGELADCTPGRFFEGILINGGGPYFDGISFHAYDYYYLKENLYGNISWTSNYGKNSLVPASFMKAKYLRKLLSQYGFPEKYLLNTETALLCGRDQGEPECHTEIFEMTKANYVAQSYAVARGEGFKANIWYHYQQGWRSSGLVKGTLEPLPALDAFRFAAQFLDGAFYRDTIIEYGKIFGYKFLRATSEDTLQEVWVLWSIDGSEVSYILPDYPLAIYNVFGESLPAGQALKLTASPLYIEFNP